MDLQDLWFCLIAFFFAAYFVLEGFDFGVGLLLPFLPRNEEERSTMFRTIGPVWDGNEVWLVIAGAAMFAAFPAWYATMFSGFYVALLLLLVFLIVRVLSFEWRERHEQSRWLGVWAWANTIGSLGAALIWGVAFSNLLYGVPINSSGDFDGSFWDLFNLYTLLGGVAVVLLFAFHGATYLTLRTTGELCRRAAAAARRLSIATAVVGAGFLIWTVAVAVDRNDKDVFPPLLPALLAIVALLGAVVCVRLARSGWAFVLTAAGAFLVVATIFTSLYPRVMVASNDFANSLTVDNASSAHYTLKVMSVVALIVTPIILLYQAWTYHVFRGGLGGEEVAGAGRPASGAEARQRRCVPIARPAPGPPRARRAAAARVDVGARRRRGAARPRPRRSCSRASPRGPSTARRSTSCRAAARAARRRRRSAARPPPGASRSSAGARRPTCSRSCGSSSSSGGCATSPPRSTAPRAPRSRRSRSAGSTRSRRRSRATCRRSSSRSSSRSRCSCSSRRSTSISAGVMLLTLPLVPVFMWLDRPLHGAARARALAGARAARDALPRRRPRPADAARVQPRRGAGGADRATVSERVPAHDDGDAARRVPLGHRARARGDARDRARRGDRRRAPRRGRDRLRGRR